MHLDTAAIRLARSAVPRPQQRGKTQPQPNFQKGRQSHCCEPADTSLTGIHFDGDAPTVDSSAFFGFDNGHEDAKVYYKLGTSGWSDSFAGLPTAPWPTP